MAIVSAAVRRLAAEQAAWLWTSPGCETPNWVPEQGYPADAGWKRGAWPSTPRTAARGAYIKAHTVPRCNARRRRGAAKNIIAALSCLYQHVEEHGLVGEKDHPVRGFDKPRRKPSWWCQLKSTIANGRAVHATVWPWQDNSLVALQLKRVQMSDTGVPETRSISSMNKIVSGLSWSYRRAFQFRTSR
jgi:hypothetical protein